MIHSDHWPGYNGLVEIGYARHVRICYADNQFARGSDHSDGIESFWSFGKRRLAHVNRIRPDTFNLHLKETEFRFNNRRENLYRVLLKLLRDDPLLLAKHRIIRYIQQKGLHQNTYIEWFYRTYREEVLNLHLFCYLDEVRAIICWWMIEYNEQASMTLLADLRPSEKLMDAKSWATH